MGNVAPMIQNAECLKNIVLKNVKMEHAEYNKIFKK
jgi:hypothetical protein